MPHNFIESDREQAFLLPPDVREWLPEGHLAWFVLDAVEAMDLAAFYASYRADGHGRAAYEPSMMVALLLYAYARGMRSSRAIERACEEDVAYRVIAANRKPDHATLARFVERHEDPLGELFSEVLGLCAEAGLVQAGVIAIDGTKVEANASRDADRDYEQIARDILDEAKAVDRKTSASERRAATSCRRTCRREEAAWRGCATPSAATSSAAPRRPGRCRARASNDSRRRSAGSRSTCRCTAAQTPPTRLGGRGGSAPTGRTGWLRARPSPTGRPRRRRARST